MENETKVDETFGESPASLLINLLKGFYWFDEGLQHRLRKDGWSAVTRPQSMVVANVVAGVHRPSEMARMLGVSRQAIHPIINQLIDEGILQMVDDPKDRRSKIVTMSPEGERRRIEARRAMMEILDKLAKRIGKQKVKALHAAFTDDWGSPID